MKIRYRPLLIGLIAVGIAGCGTTIHTVTIEKIPGPTITKYVKVPVPGPTITKTIAPSIQSRSTAQSPPIPDVNGATHSQEFNCNDVQCTTEPGSGPNGGTCGAIVDNEQICVW